MYKGYTLTFQPEVPNLFKIISKDMDESILTNYPIKSNCLRHGCDDVLGEIAMSRSILSNGNLTCRCWVAWMVQVQSPHLSLSLLVWGQKLLQYMQYTTNLQYNKPTVCCRYLCSSMRSYSSISTLRGNPITGSGQFRGSPRKLPCSHASKTTSSQS